MHLIGSRAPKLESRANEWRSMDAREGPFNRAPAGLIECPVWPIKVHDGIDFNETYTHHQDTQSAHLAY